MKYFRIKNWDAYQHYKDRAPPWIKLHREILSSQTWVMLDDDKKALAIACMLLASATDNRIPCDPDYIQRVAYLKKKPDLKPLLDLDFIEIIGNNDVADASNVEQPLAERTECASEERRDRGETERVARASKKAPKDFTPDLSFASETIPDVDAAAEAARFKDYEFKKPRSDWDATWRNWIRTCKESGRYARREQTKWM